MPAIAKLKGFSSVSLVINESSPDKLPAVKASTCTPKFADCPAATVAGKLPTKLKPEGKDKPLRLKSEVPIFLTVKLLEIGVLRFVVPKLIAVVELSAISVVPSKT